tara:strand:- start:7651 stop:8499 length:849 start_codon:yes stop_codon:yes gene_type:complete
MKRQLIEGFKGEGTPDMKYYAFDWDDNIVHMPTKIVLKTEDGDEVGMSTDDFAEYRSKIGKEDFDYNGDIIVDFAEDPFRNFRTEGDKNFLIDAMRAKLGPAFDDFKEAINNGSIFSIITARGHNPNTLKQAVYNYIIDGFNGIDKDQLVKNLKKYRSFFDEDDMTDDELIKSYLDLNKYHPVSFNDEEGAANPEEAKVKAMEGFVSYIKKMVNKLNMTNKLNKKAFIKNDVSNNFIPEQPSIGFSDDDIKNVEVMSKHFKNKPDNIVKTYSTAGGIKKEYN